MIDLLKFAKMFSHIPPVPAVVFGYGWSYTPPSQYTRQIWSQFSIIRKVFLLIFLRISITHLCETRNRYLYIQRQHTLYRLLPRRVFAHIISDSKTVALLYIGKRLHQIIVYTLQLSVPRWANENMYPRKRSQSTHTK